MKETVHVDLQLGKYDYRKRTPLLGRHPYTDKRIRFCDKILREGLRYSFAESLSRGHTAIDRTSAEFHGAKEDSLLFLKFLHGHMVSRPRG